MAGPKKSTKIVQLATQAGLDVFTAPGFNNSGIRYVFVLPEQKAWDYYSHEGLYRAASEKEAHAWILGYLTGLAYAKKEIDHEA